MARIGLTSHIGSSIDSRFVGTQLGLLPIPLGDVGGKPFLFGRCFDGQTTRWMAWNELSRWRNNSLQQAVSSLSTILEQLESRHGSSVLCQILRSCVTWTHQVILTSPVIELAAVRKSSAAKLSFRTADVPVNVMLRDEVGRQVEKQMLSLSGNRVVS